MDYNIDDKVYYLAIKNGKNSYQTLEWNKISLYKGENLYTLQGIDSFTRQYAKVDLVLEALNQNIVAETDKFVDFAIIYFEKGRQREVKEGTIFKEDADVMDEHSFIDFIADNVSNKELTNNIVNICNGKSIEEQKFKFVMKNLNYLESKGNEATRAALKVFSELTYDAKRKIILETCKKIIPRISQRNTNILIKKEEKVA